MNTLITIGVCVAAIIVIIALFLIFFYKKAPTNMALVITGMGKKRFVIGNSTVIIPGFQRVDRLNLGTVQADIHTNRPIPTVECLSVNVNAVANFQISDDPVLIEIAAKNYLNQPKELMMRDVSEVLQGKMREAVGQMELRNMISNREELNAKIRESAHDDMKALGLELVTFNIQEFSDTDNVINDLGADQSAEIKKSAAFARIKANQEVAVRQNELDLKEAELKKQADKARAEAEMVFKTVTAEKEQALFVAEQEARIAQKTKEIELQEREVAVTERKLEAEVRKTAEAEKFAAQQRADAKLYTVQKQAEADRYNAEQDALAVKAKAEADAAAVRMSGEAEAAKIEVVGKAQGESEKAVGLGKAEAIQAQIDAYNAAVNSTYLADKYLEQLPEVAKAVALPLAKVDSITMYGEGNQAALIRDTTNTLTQLSNGLAEATGIDLRGIMNSMIGCKIADGAGNVMKSEM